MFKRLPYTLRRATLRLLRIDDLATFHAYRSNADVARFQGWSPMSIEQAADFLRSQAEHTQLIPGCWHQIGIAAAESDSLVGDMGVWLSVDQTQAEFGLSIHPHVQGQGYGTESVLALLRLLFTSSPVEEIIAKTDIRNLPCLAVLARAGLRYKATHTVSYKGELCTEQVFSTKREAHNGDPA